MAGKAKLSARTPRMAKGKQGGAHIKFAKPEAARREDNGWQMRCKDLKSRVALLFNHELMSDVIFVADSIRIPAHRFILSSASPVFYRQLYDQDEKASAEETGCAAALLSAGICRQYSQGSGIMSDAMNAPAPPLVVEIHVPYNAFYEFLHFIYTDKSDITLDNVFHLIVLADLYKVPGISEQCTDFLRREVSAATALRIIRICRDIQYKAMVGQWKEATVKTKQAKMQNLDALSGGLGSVARRGSTASIMSVSRQSRRTSSAALSVASFSMKDELESVISASEVGDVSVMGGAGTKSLKDNNFDINKIYFTGKMLDMKISDLVEQLRLRCWNYICKETEVTLASDDIWDQDVETLRALLRLETLSASEIVLFRSVNEWAERNCQKLGLPVIAENKRKVLGLETIKLLRFPAMTPDQFQWEVVPTGLLTYQETQSVLLPAEEAERLDAEKFFADEEAELEAGQFIRRQRTYRGASRPRVADGLGEDSVASSMSQPANPAYAPLAGDHLDHMLGTELLSVYLRQSVDDQLANEGGASLQDGSGSRGGERLPPISGPSSPAGGSKKKKNRDQMVLGMGLHKPSGGQGEDTKATAREPVAADDFVRLATGLYSFRGDRLLEIWAEQGEAMVKDHGQKFSLAELESLIDEAAAGHGMEDRQVRRVLGLGEAPPLGRGLPLASFLVKQ